MVYLEQIVKSLPQYYMGITLVKTRFFVHVRGGHAFQERVPIPVVCVHSKIIFAREGRTVERF